MTLYVNKKPVDWRDIIHAAHMEGCIWRNPCTRSCEEAIDFLRKKGGYEITTVSPCEEKLKIAMQALIEISKSRYKITGSETEEAHTARKAIENLKEA